MPTLAKERIEETTEKKPFVKALRDALEQELTQAGWFLEQCESAEETRFCIWDGQSPDGRKWKKLLGKEVFPWEGASDMRVRTGDMIVNEAVAARMLSLWGANLQVRAFSTAGGTKAAPVRDLMRWMFFNHLEAELDDEAELLANYVEMFGSGIVGTFWHRDFRLKRETLDLQEVVAQIEVLTGQVVELAESAPEQAEQMQGMVEQAQAMLEALMDTDQDTSTITMLMEYLTVERKEARRILRELRRDGISQYWSRYVHSNRPRIKALRPYRDIFFPREMDRCENSRWHAVREWYDETDLMRMVEEGWDENYVRAMLKHKGARSHEQYPLRQLERRVDRKGWTITEEDHSQEVEVFSFYYKAPYMGATAIWRTVICMHVKPGPATDADGGEMMVPEYALHELCYEGGEYPFTEFARERTSRPLLESRGILECVDSEQEGMKRMRDYRADRASMVIFPPLKYPARLGKPGVEFGPKSMLAVKRVGQEDWSFLQTPPLDPGTMEVDANLQRQVNEYAGRFAEGVAPALQQLLSQHKSGRWMKGWKRVIAQIYCLMRAYVGEREVLAVTGDEEAATLWDQAQKDPQMLAGMYEFELLFDPRALDWDFLSEKIEMVMKYILPLDTLGLTDRAQLIEWMWRCIDPALARQVVRPQQAVTDDEVKDETMALTALLSGVKYPLQMGVNHALRLETLVKAVEANSEMQMKLGESENARLLVGERIGFHQAQLQQQQNAVTGRMGVKAVELT